MWQFSADKNVPHLLQCDRDRQPSRAHRNSPDSHLLGHLARLPDDTWHQEKWRGETYFIWIFYQLSSPSLRPIPLSLPKRQIQTKLFCKIDRLQMTHDSKKSIQTRHFLFYLNILKILRLSPCQMLVLLVFRCICIVLAAHTNWMVVMKRKHKKQIIAH